MFNKIISGWKLLSATVHSIYALEWIEIEGKEKYRKNK